MLLPTLIRILNLNAEDEVVLTIRDDGIRVHDDNGRRRPYGLGRRRPNERSRLRRRWAGEAYGSAGVRIGTSKGKPSDAEQDKSNAGHGSSSSVTVHGADTTSVKPS